MRTLLRVVLLLASLARDAAAAAFTCAGAPTNDVATCAVFAALYTALNGTAGGMTNWTTAAAGIATDYCTFAGVACNSTSTPYVPNQLLLNGKNLSGTIPPAVASLSALTLLCARARSRTPPRAPHRLPLSRAASCTTMP